MMDEQSSGMIYVKRVVLRVCNDLFLERFLNKALQSVLELLVCYYYYYYYWGTMIWGLNDKLFMADLSLGFIDYDST
jgi:hypothetical protein